VKTISRFPLCPLLHFLRLRGRTPKEATTVSI